MLDVLIVFGAQVIYVSTMTLRLMLMMRGQRYQAAAISIAEIIIWVYALSLVMQHLTNPVRLLAYAVGYATGIIVGSWLEDRLAFGFVTVQVITGHGEELSRVLRERGFGVTSWPARGRDGERHVLTVVARRRWGSHLYQIIDSIDRQAFILTLEPRAFRGGFLTRQLPVGLPPIATMPAAPTPPKATDLAPSGTHETPPAD